MSNCSKEEVQIIINSFLEREFNKIQTIIFPKTREREITDKECINEIKSLLNTTKSNKTSSKLIIKHHKSLIYANRKDYLSPYDYWQKLKQDKELFKKFYENRLRCSDWFKEKNGKNFHYLSEGYVPEFIYGIGLSTSRKAPLVSYFKPMLAKNIILKYLNEFNTIFDPCAGYSGRMLGTIGANKNYIGYDINNTTINESNTIINFIKPFISTNIDLKCCNSLEQCNEFECMLTCTPYADKEIWKDNNNVIKSNLSCDEWIDKLLNNYKCKKYIFIVDNTEKYKNYIVEELVNISHFGNNKEYIIAIQ